MNKAALSTWLRRAGLMHLADTVRFRVLHHEPGQWQGYTASQDVWVLRKN